MLEQGLFPHLSLPLYRDYGELTHSIEPVLGGAHVLGIGSERVPGLEDAWPGRELRAAERGEELWAAFAGLRSALGSSQHALSLLAHGGLVGADDVKPALASELRADLRLLGLSVQGTAYDQRATAVASARLGAIDGLRVGARAEASSAGGSAEAQWLLPDTWENPYALLLGEGVSLGGELGIPWTSWLASEVTADYDASAERLLGLGSSLSYRHPCGCVSAVGWAGQRVGRGGIDAWLGVDLLP